MDPVVLACFLTLAFIGLIVYILRTAPKSAASKIIAASATLMAVVPTILLIAGGGQ